MTEEVWSWWQPGLIHTSTRPTVDELAAAADGDAQVLVDAGIVLSQIRKAKSEAKVSMRTPVATTTVQGPSNVVARVELAGLATSPPRGRCSRCPFLQRMVTNSTSP